MDERLARPECGEGFRLASHLLRGYTSSRMTLPDRKWLRHDVPAWVSPEAAVFFVTLCCKPRGHNQLCTQEIAGPLFETVKHRVDRNAWFPYVFLLMPDHVHALLSFHPQGAGMKEVISLWKSWTARQLGIRWQRGFFDHRLRNDENHRDKANYIMLNPVRAGLVNHPSDWPYLWFPGARVDDSASRPYQGGGSRGR